MSQQDVYLVEELKKNKIEDNFRLLKVAVYTTTFFDVLLSIMYKYVSKNT